MPKHSPQTVTVALANHRPETIAPAVEWMAGHEAVFLEEPASVELDRMLEGDLPIEDYLQTVDTEYPEFTRRLSVELRRLHAAGKTIAAVEPFLEHLVAIHEFFADGGAPAGLTPGTDRQRVYLAEREATGALLDFYQASATAPFEGVVAAVKRFARSDARRFALRDRMRAAALAKRVRQHRSSYVEAGQMHYGLWRCLQDKLGDEIAVRPRFLMASAVRRLGLGRHLYGPGDVLTLLYLFHPRFRDPIEDLLAARSLIYSKLIAKEEVDAGPDPYPHTRNELHTATAVNRLSLPDCRTLFAVIRRQSTRSSVIQVERYLDPQS